MSRPASQKTSAKPHLSRGHDLYRGVPSPPLPSPLKVQKSLPISAHVHGSAVIFFPALSSETKIKNPNRKSPRSQTHHPDWRFAVPSVKFNRRAAVIPARSVG